jgi:rhamnose utilization protein RhaD (predicted bifunctional aldolase and dehydrogenase)
MAADSLSRLLEEVARLSRRFGSDPEYTRGGGGNSSAKAGGVLYIKASGRSLATLTAEELMPLRMEPLRSLLDGGAGEPATPGTDEIMRTALAARVQPADDRRPSVECLFHALLPEPIVLHSHPTVVNALTCAREGRQISAQLFGDQVLWVPYIDPGLPLARLIDAQRRRYEQRTGRAAPRAMLLQNHGMIVTGESADEVTDGCERIVGAVRGRLEPAGSGSDALAATNRPSLRAAIPVLKTTLRELLAGDRPTIVLFDDSPAAQEIASAAAGRELVASGPLTPDQIVYTGSWPLWIEPSGLEDPQAIGRILRDSLEQHVAKTGGIPSVAVVGGLGVFIVADSERFAATAREVLFDAMRVARGAARLGGVRVLAPDERRFIEEWEAEAYRRGVETTAPKAGRTA